MHYPFGNANGDEFANYEIDRERGVFLAAGVDLSDHFPEREDDLLDECNTEANSRRKWTEATDTTVVHEAEKIGRVVVKTIILALSHMVRGDIKFVRQFLDKSSDADLFLNGVEAYLPTLPKYFDDNDVKEDENESIEELTVTGKTALHFASCEMYPKIVELLLERGADPNVRDVNGRTPLSQAALFGRLENVETLLKHGANPLLACIRDGKRALAVDFAKNDEVNPGLRDIASYGYKEDVIERNLDRRAIVNLLERYTGTTGTTPQARSTLGGFSFTRAVAPESFLTLVAHFDVPNEWKTVGVLCRGSRFPPIAAMSGWAHRDDPAANIQIAGKDWTDAVRRVSQYIGHNLSPHRHDQGQSGRFHACHAEKQLVAYFLSRHIFLNTDTMEGWRDSVMEGEAYWLGATPVSSVVHVQSRLSRLSEVQPPVSLRKGTIMVFRPQCLDCKDFVARVNKVLGLDIRVIGSSAV
jgi:hypothetical protein